MYLRGGGALTKSRVALGCAGLICGASVSSFIYDANTEKRLIKLINSTGNKISEFFKSESPKPGEKRDPSVPFTLSSLWEKMNPFWNQATNALWSIASYVPSFGSGSLNFLKYFLDWKNVSELFREIHIKLWRVTKFGLDKEKRNKFFELFNENNWTNTLETVKLLLQMPSSVNKYLKSEANLFNHVLLKFFDNPQEIARKFGRLTKNIIGEFNKEVVSCSPLAASFFHSKNNIYGLNQNDLDVYLGISQENIKKQNSRSQASVEKVEDIFEKLWHGEICMKHDFGMSSNDMHLPILNLRGKQSIAEMHKDQAINMANWGVGLEALGWLGLGF